MARAHCMLDTKGHKNTLRMCYVTLYYIVFLFKAQLLSGSKSNSIKMKLTNSVKGNTGFEFIRNNAFLRPNMGNFKRHTWQYFRTN